MIPLCLVGCAAVALGAGSARAADAAAAVPLRFDEAVGAAPAASLGRQAAAAAREAQRGFAARTPGALGNPELSSAVGPRLAPEGGRGLEWRIAIEQPVALGGLGGARRQAVAAEGRLLEARVGAAALGAQIAGAHGWIGLWEAEQAAAQAGQNVAAADELVRLVGLAARAGEQTRIELLEVQGFAAEARLRLLDAEGGVAEARLELSQALGRPPGWPVVTAGPLPDPPLPEARRAALRAAVDRLPAVALRRLERDAERARLVEETAARRPWLRLGGAAERDLPGGLVVFGTAALGLPLFDRGARERGGRAAEAALAEGARGEAARSATFEVAHAEHELVHMGALLVHLEREVVPTAARAYAARERLLSQGEGTALEILLARRAVVAAAAEVSRVRARRAWAAVKLWLFLQAAAGPAPGGAP
jgi:cobalt-zinc-cadmium efflux system outer membrane protein